MCKVKMAGIDYLSQDVFPDFSRVASPTFTRAEGRKVSINRRLCGNENHLEFSTTADTTLKVSFTPNSLRI